jgi:hypothetical protein
MTPRIAAVLLAGVVGLGCSSSKGDPGPQGPTGPTGPTGPQGSLGNPGASVLSAQLAVGSVACPTGGSQFTSISGTTFACNGEIGAKGDQGIQGPTGPTGPPGPAAAPRPVVKTATGSVLGPLLGIDMSTGNMSALHVYVESIGKAAQLLQATGYAMHYCDVLYASADCSGPPVAGSNMNVDLVAHAGSRLWFCDSASPFETIIHSTYSGATASCTQVTAIASGVCLPREAGDPRYPYAAPLQVVYE